MAINYAEKYSSVVDEAFALLSMTDKAVNKDYADLKVALTAFTGANQNLTQNGYQKLPGGLIIQWGFRATGSATGTITLPISFPNLFASVNGSDATTGERQPLAVRVVNNSSFSYLWGSSDQEMYWMAIGY